MIFICQIQNILFLVSQLDKWTIYMKGHVGQGHFGIHHVLIVNGLLNNPVLLLDNHIDYNDI